MGVEHQKRQLKVWNSADQTRFAPKKLSPSCVSNCRRLPPRSPAELPRSLGGSEESVGCKLTIDVIAHNPVTVVDAVCT
jgi:hypothetical protein